MEWYFFKKIFGNFEFVIYSRGIRKSKVNINVNWGIDIDIRGLGNIKIEKLIFNNKMFFIRGYTFRIVM